MLRHILTLRIFTLLEGAFLLAASVLYVTLVAFGYRTEGQEYHVTFDPRHPARSAERALVGMGVKVTGATVRASESLLDSLYESSAKFGEWFTRKYVSPRTRERIRSRFL